MSTQIKSLPFDADFISDFSKQRKEPEWFAALRNKAFRLAEELPLPKPEKTRISDWNFTDCDCQPKGTAVASLKDLPKDIRDLTGGKKHAESENVLVHHNGEAVFGHLSESLKAQGVIFADLQTALRDHGDLVEKYYFKAGRLDKHRLTALHAALVNSGTFLYIPKNVVLNEPIQAIYFQDAPSFGLVSHTIIVAENGSSATYVETYLSDDTVGQGIASLVSEVFVGENAQVKFGAVDCFSKDVVTYVNRQGIVQSYGTLEWALGQMNDGNTVSENVTELVGQGGSADTKAVSIGRGKQKQNFDNYIRHIGKGTISRMMVRGVQTDAARSIFNARTKIERGASKADGEQAQRVLMLSDEARGDANPILLIDEYDVVAGHAASAGRVDPMQLYYLMSRGIHRRDAERLIVNGFLAPVVNQLPIEGVQSQLRALIERRLR